MKITPVAQGSPTPNLAETPRSPDKIARAKAIAAGQEAAPLPESSGDPQVDKINSRRIKMKTQMSTNRDDALALDPALVAETLEQTTETPISDTVEQASDTEETRPLSPQFAALAKTKRALQVKERELAAREEALKTQAPAGQENVMAKLKANPLSVLQEAGVTYDQLTEAILSSQSSPEINELKNELRALKEELNTQFTTRDQSAEQQVLAELKKETLALTSQGDQFEAIREAKAQRDVVELIHRNWKETGEVMSVTEAAELVEDQLIEEALPFARIKKVQSRLTPAQEQMIAQTPIAQKPNTKIMRTLTNRDNASPVMDKRARAIAAMNGTLKRG